MEIREGVCVGRYVPRHVCPSHVSEAAREAGAVALKAEQLKRTKCTLLESSHHFVLFVLETSGVLGQAALDLNSELGQCLCQTTGESHSRQYFLQRRSIAVQRGNAAVLGITTTDPNQSDPFWDQLSYLSYLFAHD